MNYEVPRAKPAAMSPSGDAAFHYGSVEPALYLTTAPVVAFTKAA